LVNKVIGKPPSLSGVEGMVANRFRLRSTKVISCASLKNMVDDFLSILRYYFAKSKITQDDRRQIRIQETR
jgi:hypothetical protein